MAGSRNRDGRDVLSEPGDREDGRAEERVVATLSDVALVAPPNGASPHAGEPAIVVRALTKRFDEVEAVRGVSFEVAAGETFGFLRPNGAGKSTTISILRTLLRPTSGSASVAGFDVVAEPLRVRSRIGLVFQDTTLDDYLTAGREPPISRPAVRDSTRADRGQGQERSGDGRPP
jgi:ABC-type sugar transport system ATPase subunit